jgi:RNA polymerase sigma-70 factor (ECF subfamily)
VTSLQQPSTPEVLREGLRAVYRERGAALFAFAYRLTGSEGAAEDVVHESVLRVLDGRCRVDAGRGDLALLLFGIVRNVAREQRRTIGREAPQAPRDRPGVPERPEHVLTVQHALQALPETDREVIILSAYHGYSPREIAVILGRTSLVVRVRLHRARTRLKRLLLDRPAQTADTSARLGFRP